MRLLWYFGANLAVLATLHLAFDLASLGDWGYSLLGMAIALLLTPIDREGFYGPRDDGAARS